MNQTRGVIQKRRDQILAMLKERDIVFNSELCRQLQVTEITIRRDLIHLESQGKLIRVHGGAKCLSTVEENRNEPSVDGSIDGDPHRLRLASKVSDRIHVNHEKKALIARCAAKYVEPLDAIFLNSGSTGLYLVQYLSGKNVHIISNNAVMALLDRPSDTALTIIGGEHYALSQSFVGPAAKEMILSVIASKCFLCCSGISVQNGITCSSIQETEVNRLMIHNTSGKRIIIADGSKIGKAYNFISCRVSDIDMLITDVSADPTELHSLEKAGITVIIASEASV